MARIALVLALTILAASFAAQSRAAFETARVDGVKCIDAVALGESFGLRAFWTEPDKRLVLQNATTRVELEVNQREAIFDGRHVFLGTPPVYHQRSIWISWIDTEDLLAPLLRLGRDRPLPVHTIVIDPGHGIPDNGAENKHLGLKERVLTLDTAFRLKKILEAQGYKVVMTRTTDYGISPDKKLDLRRRAELTAEVKADLFISIHFNSAGQYVAGEKVAAVIGTETFRFTPRYQAPISRSAHKAEDDEANPGDKNDQWNTLLGYCIHHALLGEIGSYDRGLRHDKFEVIRLAPCPAVLVESGYLTNDAEARKIATPAYRQQIAEGIANGVRAYASLGQPPPAPATEKPLPPPAAVKPASPPVTKPISTSPPANLPAPAPSQK
ncbi:MAG TPA: N-acetylmuramoyl-L-alanine amidase [Opitutaceae bacterium]|nr:N-acetylmuramoyl-L-alanine amidase [Opitutaceae bacterium]